MALEQQDVSLVMGEALVYLERITDHVRYTALSLDPATIPWRLMILLASGERFERCSQ
jgi:hypothetical protein